MPKTPWDSLDPDDLPRLRDKLLRHQVRFQLYPFSAFYRKVLDDLGVRAGGFAGTADLGKLPVVDRATLAERNNDFLLTPTPGSMRRWSSATQLYKGAWDRLLRGLEYARRELANEYEPVHVFETAAADTESVSIYLTRRDLATLATQGRRMLEVAGVKESDILANLLEPISSGAFWPVWMSGVSLGLRQIAPGPLTPDEVGSSTTLSSATVLIARAEDALAVLEKGEDRLANLRLLILAPEPVSAGLRSRLIEAAGSLRIVSTYRFAEGRALWAECIEGAGSPDAGFHLSPDLELIETISPSTGEPAGGSEPGEIVFTGLDQRGTALARYRPGDVAVGGLVPGRCPYCGRIVDRIVGPVVRASNLIQITLAGTDRVTVDVEAFAEALAHPGLASWQVEIGKEDGDPRGDDEVFVHFTPKKDRDPAVLAVELDRLFQSEIGFSPSQFVVQENAGNGIIDTRPVPVGNRQSSVANDPDASSHVRLWRRPPAG